MPLLTLLTAAPPHRSRAAAAAPWPWAPRWALDLTRLPRSAPPRVGPGGALRPARLRARLGGGGRAGLLKGANSPELTWGSWWAKVHITRGRIQVPCLGSISASWSFHLFLEAISPLRVSEHPQP